MTDGEAYICSGCGANWNVVGGVRLAGDCFCGRCGAPVKPMGGVMVVSEEKPKRCLEDTWFGVVASIFEELCRFAWFVVCLLWDSLPRCDIKRRK